MHVTLGALTTPVFDKPLIQHGPGRKTLYTRWKNIDSNTYGRMGETSANTEIRWTRQTVRAAAREKAKALVRLKKTGEIISRHKFDVREAAKKARRAA